MVAVTETMVSFVSPFQVNEAGPFTSALYQYYKEVARSRLDNDNPGFPEAVYDHCHALLIAHLYAIKEGDTALTQFKSRDIQWSKQAGSTPMMLEYLDTLRSYQTEELQAPRAQLDVTRSDANVGNLRMDRSKPASFFDRRF